MRFLKNIKYYSLILIFLSCFTLSCFSQIITFKHIGICDKPIYPLKIYKEKVHNDSEENDDIVVVTDKVFNEKKDFVKEIIKTISF